MNNIQKILYNLNLDHFYPKFLANKVETDTFKGVSVDKGQLRLRPQIQELLMTDCGLSTN